MANISPFRALRYDTSNVALESVLTQPYDKITPEMQQRYYSASPHNLIAFELGRIEATDDATSNRYSRAASFLKHLRRDGVLIQDSRPAIYAYSQTFSLPADPTHSIERRGFVALCQLSDYGEGIVHRHELTLSKPREDRLQLLRATRTHSGQIFMLYSDPAADIDALVWAGLSTMDPTASMRDEYGVQHQIWKLDDAGAINQVRAAMAEKQLIIADGHHRYETALHYRNERRAQELSELADNGRTGQLAIRPNAPYEHVMATFINMDSPAMVILPTHRVLRNFSGFEPRHLLDRAADFFEIEPLPAGAIAETAMNTLAALAPGRSAFAVFSKTGDYILKSRSAAIDKELRALSPQQRSLDVVQLHKVLLERVIGMRAQDFTEQRYITYYRDAAEAVAQLRAGADAAFLMNPVRIEQLRDVAFAGEVMPQKSTDFYPKLMSGITLYSLD